MLLLSTMVLKEGMKRTESKDAIKADLDGNLEGSKVAMAMVLQSTIGLEESIRAWQQE